MDTPLGSIAQGYAINIEHILCNVFECERFGFGGIVNSDFIRKQPFTAMACGLAFIYATCGSLQREEILAFIGEYEFFKEMALDTLLSFDTSSKDIDGVTFELNYKNGHDAVENMVEDFRKLCKSRE